MGDGTIYGPCCELDKGDNPRLFYKGNGGFATAANCHDIELANSYQKRTLEASILNERLTVVPTRENLELEVGKYYRVKHVTLHDIWIMKITDIKDSGEHKNIRSISLYGTTFYRESNWGSTSYCQYVEDATSADIRHLDACIRADKFVPYPTESTINESYSIF